MNLSSGIHQLEARFSGNTKFASSRSNTTLLISQDNIDIEIFETADQIKYKTDSSPIVATSTLLNFFEFIEDMYPRILQRYKGLGSSAPKITRAIVTDPRTRRAVKITMNNIDTHTRIGILMGDSKEQKLARKGLLMEFPFTKEMLDN